VQKSDMILPGWSCGHWLWVGDWLR